MQDLAAGPANVPVERLPITFADYQDLPSVRSNRVVRPRLLFRVSIILMLRRLRELNFIPYSIPLFIALHYELTVGN